MRCDPTCSIIRRFTLLSALLSVLSAFTSARAQIVPTPGFPYDTYKVSNDSSPHFCRLTDTELIYAEKQHGITKLFSRNYVTGVESEITPVNALLVAQTSLSPSEIHVSPDRKWAAWPASRGGSDGVWVIKLAGKAGRFIEMPVARIISWAPEPDTIICFSADESEYSRLGFYNMVTGELDSDFHIARHSGLAGLNDGSGHRFLVCFCSASDHRAWSVTNPPAFKTGSIRFGLGGAAVFGMYDLSDTTLAKVSYAIGLPQKCDLIQGVVSPHQKYVIWQLGFQGTTEQLGRLGSTELWISDMNGMHMRRAVVMLDAKNSTYVDSEPPIADVMWLPTGRKIGCRIGGTLYIVHLDIDKDQPEP